MFSHSFTSDAIYVYFVAAVLVAVVTALQFRFRFLQYAFFVMRAQKTLERILDGFFLPVDIPPQTAQGNTGVIRDGAVWLNLAGQIVE